MCRDLEGGCEATANPLDSPGQTCEEYDGDELELKLKPGEEMHHEESEEEVEGEGERLRRESVEIPSEEDRKLGLKDGEEDTFDEEEIEGDDDHSLKEEREQGDGEESSDLADLEDKVLDFDEDKRNPQYIPKKGAFYQHDDRMMGDDEVPESQEEEKNEDDKGARRQKKLWHDEGVWGHDMYRAEEQAPKTSEELVDIYGYDIRSEQMPPRARRRRRYGRGPNKYQRNWEDEDAYSGRSAPPRGGRRPRGAGHSSNPPFGDEDFPDLNRGTGAPDSSPAQQGRQGEEAATKSMPFKTFSAMESGSRRDDREQSHRTSGRGMPRQLRQSGWQGGRKENLPKQPENGDLPRDGSSQPQGGHSGQRKNWPLPQPPMEARGSSEWPHSGPSAGGRARAGKRIPTDEEWEAEHAEIIQRLTAKSSDHQEGNV